MLLQATTRIKYVTDGLLLREMMDDPLLTRYRWGGTQCRIGYAWPGHTPTLSLPTPVTH